MRGPGPRQPHEGKQTFPFYRTAQRLSVFFVSCLVFFVPQTDLIERLLRADEEAASASFLTSEVSKGPAVSNDAAGIEGQHALLSAVGSSLDGQAAGADTCPPVSVSAVSVAPLVAADAAVDSSAHDLSQKKALETFPPTGGAGVSKIDSKDVWVF